MDFLMCTETYQEHTMITKEIVKGTHCPTSGALCILRAVVLVHPTFHLPQDEMEGLGPGGQTSSHSSQRRAY